MVIVAGVAILSAFLDSQLLQLPLRNEAVLVPVSGLIVSADHFPQFVRRQTYACAHAGWQCFAQ
jgi:hypothetical protein